MGQRYLYKPDGILPVLFWRFFCRQRGQTSISLFQPMSILRHLMAGPASLTQLGHALGQHPTWVRHHLVRLAQAGLLRNIKGDMIDSAGQLFIRRS
jgi:DNA-binding MarR family transcriptional regulator